MPVEPLIEAREVPNLSQSAWFRPRAEMTEAGDLIVLLTADQSRYLITLRTGEQLHTHYGIFRHEDLIGCSLGVTVSSTMGHPGLLLEPSLEDMMRRLKRGTQIIYPKDAAYLVHRLNLRAGCTVIEAGTGSGGLTMALAWAVAPTGRVYTYEVRDDTYRLARNNLERVGLLPFVQMHLAAADEGFQQRGVDALFLDVREPWLLLDHVRSALKPGGFFASLLPTTNQVSALIEAMERSGFADLAVEELLLRAYKPVPDRLRPEDTMPAHSGYLIFGRCLVNSTDAGLWLPKARQRYLARVQAEARIAAETELRVAQQGDQPAPKYPILPLP